VKRRTHKASGKRFKVTAGGRIFHFRACRKHKLSKVRAQYRRQAGRLVEVTGGDRKVLKELLNL